MKIALCTIGSRGDVQPFLVLGEYLSKQGHQVKVSSAKMYESLASEYDVEYVAFEGDYESIMDDSKLKKKIGKNPFALGKALKEQVYPIIENSLATYYDLLKWSDVILYHPKTMIDGIGSEMQHKLIKTYVVPFFTPTRTFTNPVLMFLPVPKFLNKLTYKFANAMMNSLSTPVKNFRKKNHLPKSDLLLETPVLYGISPSFLEVPKDYPKDHIYSGFWLKENKKDRLSEKLVKFLAKKQKTLIITFGSMPYQSKTDINVFIDAIIQKHNVNVLIVKGWGLNEVEIKESNQVLVIDYAPFELLFPQADYIIHHGSAGTTAMALKAGLPQMICPILHPFGDQYFWGKQVQNMEVGVAPIPLKKLTVSNLLSSFNELKADKLKVKAKALQSKINNENGFLVAEKFIEAQFELQ